MTEKIIEPPYSKESEQMVLGSMLTSVNSLNIAAEALDSLDFYQPEHQIIFDVLKTACKNDKSADIHLVCEELKRQNKLKVIGGAAYVTSLAQYAGTSAFIEEYAEVVKNKAILRRLIKAGQEITRKGLSDPSDVNEAIEQSNQILSDITSFALDTKGACNIRPYTLEDLIEELSKTEDGLETGYTELDKMIRIPNEAITLIGGRPSHGKTTFMMNMFLNLIDKYPDRQFYFFSYEETRQQIAVKIINMLSGFVFDPSKNLITLTGYLKCKEVTRVVEEIEVAKRKYQELTKSGRLVIISDPFYIHKLPSIIATLETKGSIGAVFIDYIQKIKNARKFGTRQLELANTSNIILETAKTYSIPIILGAQLGRDKDSKDKVKLDNLREAGDLEQDASLVLGIHNPSMEKAQDEMQQLTDRIVEITVTPLKNRNGIVNKTIKLEFDRPILKIKDKDKK